ncbi:high mobility group B protein 15 isoform X2 [Malus domestica]|uniref:high mobility group B protein 15 isoform X2 n=1 Tax=Malus domestica TaxID=3750 RepID=UPI0007EC448F|nr:high mobility group B protein 15 isoform X2 [Malus domestica]XP_028956598.1 high mobility group B protein 15 isoform X2 [Malus domestica]
MGTLGHFSNPKPDMVLVLGEEQVKSGVWVVNGRTRKGDLDVEMASPSCATSSKSPLPMKDTTSSSQSHLIKYPAPLAKLEEVASNPKLFMSTLEKLHASMGTKFMIPIIGGKELDLHKLFVEVTSRGGLEKIIRDRRWKEVTAVFNFPSTATNASFVLRKYYHSLLLHYEQIYYFKALAWDPLASESSRSPSVTALPSPRGGAKRKSAESPSVHQQTPINSEMPGARTTASSEDTVTGVIDGKFENGYLVTVIRGSTKLRGVLYQSPRNPAQEVPPVPQNFGALVNRNDSVSATPGVQQRRRRRKKSEIKRRDPAHPKPNRSGYNFFFAEQHARLKPLHPGKDREISRMIGELWNKLKEAEKSVYQEKAVKDKERYRIEMEDYRERLKTGQVVSDAVPLQQRLPEADASNVESDAKIEETEAGGSAQTSDESNESSSSKTEK